MVKAERSPSPARARGGAQHPSNGDTKPTVKGEVKVDTAGSGAAHNGHAAQAEAAGADKAAAGDSARPERVQDDWQVAYTWAFIVKFELRDKIRNLECLEDFERCLMEPVAQRPDDILEGVLVRFLQNLKPGLRNVNCTNIQGSLSNYISDMLETSPEFTVWDKPWLPNEDARGSCCTTEADRLMRGRLREPDEDRKERVRRNPLKQIEAQGGGLFELDWHDRAKLLRQLVDWQLTHAESIREFIKERQPTGKRNAEVVDPLKTEPLGLDHKKNRIWSLDASARLYKSGNPFKRPCPLVPITYTRADVVALQETYTTYGNTVPPKPSGSGPKGKVSKKDEGQYKKLVNGIDAEARLSSVLAVQVLPAAEKDEARVQRAHKKAAEQRWALAMASERPSRTRRSTKKIDYTYDGFEGDEGDEDDDTPRRGGRRRGDAGAVGYDPNKGRPVIPGERRSARVRGGPVDGDDYADGEAGGGNLSSPGASGGGGDGDEDDAYGDSTHVNGGRGGEPIEVD
ncbi:uncharacterized protein EHS24_001073 [Apiotrichum porosum]|uniref:WHIM1 domain-containing protein n=1 Tax=Apiotrichum porosum TaxID=105984 RepID=A0A427YBR5_9TREE|nr:uncharacterized protein EHS24_001073 [Apiotrichum porosum]RSH88528.1 hypothetical protein EHS24_001073 [Apiotrichum porosum]